MTAPTTSAGAVHTYDAECMHPSHHPAADGHVCPPLTPPTSVQPAPEVGERKSIPRVVGLDLSLSATGVAGRTWAETIVGGALTENATREEEWARLRRIRGKLAGHIDTAALVVVEGPSYGSKGGHAHERAFLWWWTVGRCISREVPYAVVQPSTLKVYATGSGRASKEDVVQEVQRRRTVTFRGNNEADALTLAAMGLDHLGHAPVVMPQTHRRALDSVSWPEVAA